MPLTHLELQPGFGDETINETHFVLRGDATDEIVRQGLRFIPGEACVSADIGREVEKWSVESGRVYVLTVPADFHAGYPVLDTAFIARAEKLVIGAPMRYARARAELSLYMGADTNGEATKIESEMLNGSPLSDHPAFTVDPKNILGSFAVTPQLRTVLKRLEVGVDAFEPIDYAEVETALAELFECRQPAQAVLVPTMVHDVVVRTVETLIIAKMRLMRWVGLAALGYKFKEGSEDVQISPPKDMSEQRTRMASCKKLAQESAIFAGEMAWLKAYILRELELMRIELDGAELEAAER